MTKKIFSATDFGGPCSSLQTKGSAHYVHVVYHFNYCQGGKGLFFLRKIMRNICVWNVDNT